MDPRSYKDIQVRSGHTYHTFVSPPANASQPTILFVHGFPSTANDWRNQVPFFVKAGYGVIAPDLLGHGGSSKPVQLDHYLPSKVAADLIDLVEHCKVTNVVAIGHDWGSILVSRLGHYHPHRFAAFGFLATPYCPPLIKYDIEDTLKKQAELTKTEFFGYWLFLGQERAVDIVNAHLESLLSLWYTAEPTLWSSVLTMRNKLEPWLTAGSTAPFAPFISPQDKARMLADWKKAGGLGPALKWFKVMTSDLMAKDDAGLDEKATLLHPVFLAGCERDAVCWAAPAAAITQNSCPNAKILMFDTSHWVQLEAPEKLNRELLDWLQGVFAK